MGINFHKRRNPHDQLVFMLYLSSGTLSSTHTGARLYRSCLSPQSPRQTRRVHPPGRSFFEFPIATFVLWIHLRIFPKPQMSSSESLSSGRPTQERHLSYREYVTPRRVQRFTALIHRELAIWYVLFPSGTSNLILRPGSTEPYYRGWARLFFCVGNADLRIWPVQRGEHDIEHEIVFSKHEGYVFHDSRGFEGGSADELKTVQDFVRRRSQESRLRDRLHAIWFVPLVLSNTSLQPVSF
jgi:hypothetical protein